MYLWLSFFLFLSSFLALLAGGELIKTRRLLIWILASATFINLIAALIQYFINKADITERAKQVSSIDSIYNKLFHLDTNMVKQLSYLEENLSNIKSRNIDLFSLSQQTNDILTEREHELNNFKSQSKQLNESYSDELSMYKSRIINDYLSFQNLQHEKDSLYSAILDISMDNSRNEVKINYYKQLIKIPYLDSLDLSIEQENAAMKVLDAEIERTHLISEKYKKAYNEIHIDTSITPRELINRLKMLVLEAEAQEKLQKDKHN
ncbi:MAG: hypothetical protein WBP41_11375 [Saprospiraceae bacterium]